MWMIESAGHVSSRQPKRHLEWLARKLKGKHGKLKQVLAVPGTDAGFGFFWILPASHVEVLVDAKWFRILDDFGIPLTVEVYGRDF